MIFDRINNAKLRTISFYESPTILIVNNKEEEEIGYIDFTDERDNIPVHKFAFLIKSDWEGPSFIISLKSLLYKSLMQDIGVNLILVRRQVENNFYDFLIKVNTLEK